MIIIIMHEQRGSISLMPITPCLPCRCIMWVCNSGGALPSRTFQTPPPMLLESQARFVIARPTLFTSTYCGLPLATLPHDCNLLPRFVDQFNLHLLLSMPVVCTKMWLLLKLLSKDRVPPEVKKKDELPWGCDLF